MLFASWYKSRRLVKSTEIIALILLLISCSCQGCIIMIRLSIWNHRHSFKSSIYDIITRHEVCHFFTYYKPRISTGEERQEVISHDNIMINERHLIIFDFGARKYQYRHEVPIGSNKHKASSHIRIAFHHDAFGISRMRGRISLHALGIKTSFSYHFMMNEQQRCLLDYHYSAYSWLIEWRMLSSADNRRLSPDGARRALIFHWAPYIFIPERRNLLIAQNSNYRRHLSGNIS